jgi:type IV secretion system protein VirB9
MKPSITAFIFSLILASYAATAIALEKPRALATDARIKVVAYQANNVVLIQASNLINTQIIFGSNESIINYQSGDSAAWSTNVNPYVRNVLNIKPTILGSKTDLDVITETSNGKRRFYRFALSSSASKTAKKNVVYAVQFVYPEQAKAKVLAALHYHRDQMQSIMNASKNPKDYNWDYSFSGSRIIMPLHVFDDGKFTYLQLRPNQPVPAIFAVNNAKGEESVINYRRIGNTIVVEEISPQFTLRDGKYAVASVFNTREIKKIRRFGE